MNRRDSIKYIATGTLASGLLFSGCDWAEKKKPLLRVFGSTNTAELLVK